MKENLRRIGTWARRQGEHFDLYLHALPQRTRLTLIFAILALLSVTLLFICGSIYRIGRNDPRPTCPAYGYSATTKLPCRSGRRSQSGHSQKK